MSYLALARIPEWILESFKHITQKLGARFLKDKKMLGAYYYNLDCTNCFCVSILTFTNFTKRSLTKQISHGIFIIEFAVIHLNKHFFTDG